MKSHNCLEFYRQANAQGLNDLGSLSMSLSECMHSITRTKMAKCRVKNHQYYSWYDMIVTMVKSVTNIYL